MEEINWRDVLIEELPIINTDISIKKIPFAEGSMRYAFIMFDDGEEGEEKKKGHWLARFLKIGPMKITIYQK